jgi:hypothetical protein
MRVDVYCSGIANSINKGSGLFIRTNNGILHPVGLVPGNQEMDP